MTSEQLYEIVKGSVGKPWWPKQLIYRRVYRGAQSSMEWVDEQAEMCIQAERCHDLILGAAVAWLVERDECPWLEKGQCTTTDGRFGLRGKRSLLAAVLAACEAVQA